MQPTRRSFLGLLGLAPLAAPAAIAAASAPRAATVRFIGGGTPYLGAGRRILLADEVDSYAAIAAQGATAELIEQRIITWPEGPEKDRLRQELQDFVAKRDRVSTLSEWTGMRAVPVPLSFIDDAGGGP